MREVLDEATWSARYEMLEVIGRGASGTVHRARRVSDGTEVAIKELLLAWTADVDAIARDTDTFASLACEGVPRVIERAHVRQRGLEVVYLVLEHIDGVPLDREARDRRYTSGEVFLLVAELFDILARLHASGIVHRDVKPENVVRRRDGRLALVDLGSAVILRDVPADARFTAAGTLGFAPAEQISGVARPANDVYAVGALAVALLTREHPAKLLDPHLRIDWRARATLPRAQARLLDALLAPADVRPADAHALAARARQVAIARAPSRSLGSVVAMASVAVALPLAWWLRPAPVAPIEHAAPPTSSVPATPAPVIAEPPRPTTAPEWRCDRSDQETHFVPLALGESRCAETGHCRDLAAGFEGLDLEALCRDEDTPVTAVPSVVVQSERRFTTTIHGQTVACTRRAHVPYGCHVTCEHPMEAGLTQAALAERFDAYVADVRDAYGVEVSASVQGVPSYPRRQRQWATAGGVSLDLELDQSLCCAPNDQACGGTQLRTRYSLSGWPGSR